MPTEPVVVVNLSRFKSSIFKFKVVAAVNVFEDLEIFKNSM